MPTLKRLRERAMLSQGELARALGVHIHTIHNWEYGLNQPRPAHQRKMVQLFNCTPDDLLAAIEEARERSAEKERPAA